MGPTCQNLPLQICNCTLTAPLGMEQGMEFLEQPRTLECEICFAYPKVVDPIDNEQYINYNRWLY